MESKLDELESRIRVLERNAFADKQPQPKKSLAERLHDANGPKSSSFEEGPETSREFYRGLAAESIRFFEEVIDSFTVLNNEEVSDVTFAGKLKKRLREEAGL